MKFKVFFFFFFSGTGTFFSSSDREGDSIKVRQFMSLTRLQDPKLGYILNDKCIIEAEIYVIGTNSQYFPTF